MTKSKPCPNCGELHPDVKPTKIGAFNVLVCPKVTSGEVVVIDGLGKKKQIPRLQG